MLIFLCCGMLCVIRGRGQQPGLPAVALWRVPCSAPSLLLQLLSALPPACHCISPPHKINLARPSTPHQACARR